MYVNFELGPIFLNIKVIFTCKQVRSQGQNFWVKVNENYMAFVMFWSICISQTCLKCCSDITYNLFFQTVILIVNDCHFYQHPHFL